MVSCKFCRYTPVPENAMRCPECGSELDRTESVDESFAPTVCTPVGDLRKLMTGGIPPSAVPAMGDAGDETRTEAPEPSQTPEARQSSATPFRPVLRPSMALLYVLDDGKSDEGEIVRLRKDRTTVGRKEGDVVIPHDSGMSGKHIEISRRKMDGRYRWYLKDLGSLNGTFVRCDRAKLKNKFEILIGSRRFRFEDGSTPSGAPATMSPDDGHTRPWNVGGQAPVAHNTPFLVEMTPSGDGQRFSLGRLPCYIGSEPTACDVLIDNDPLVCPIHVKLENDGQGNLFIEDAKSFNGTWLRIKELPLDCNCSFQCGEQRFLLRFP